MSGGDQADGSETNGVSYRIDRDRRLVFIDCVGTIAREDFLDAQARFEQDPAFDPSYAVLLDGLKANFGQLTAEDLQAIAQNNRMAPGVRRAFVVDTAKNFGRVAVFVVMAEGGYDSPLALFETLEDAMFWLDSGGSVSG